MRIKVEAPWSRIVLVTLTLLAFALYFSGVTRTYFAARAARSHTSAGLERAVCWEPSNAEFHHQLGKYEFFSLGNGASALLHLRRATELNPYEARYWLALAAAYQFDGNVELQRDAIDHAVAVDPTTPAYTWNAANFYFAQGDHARALRLLGVVLSSTEDMGMALRAADLCWRASGGNIQGVLDRILPPTLNAHFAFLDVLTKRNDAGAARSVWKHLVMLRQPFEPNRAFAYIDSLLDTGKVDEAQQAWQLILEVNGLHSHYETGNLIANPGFDRDFIGGGFEWRMEDLPHVKIAFDDADFLDGTRSLQISFDDAQTHGAGLAQLVAVLPQSTYDFSAYARWKDILSSTGLRFLITDAYTNRSLFQSDGFLNSSVWQKIQGRFTTGPDTRLVMLRIIRDPGQTMIRGKLWIDHLKLTRGE